MKLRKLVAASAGTMLAMSAFAAPQIANAEENPSDTDQQQSETDITGDGTGDDNDLTPGAGEGGTPGTGDGSNPGDGTGDDNDLTPGTGEGSTPGDDTELPADKQLSFEDLQDAAINPGKTLEITPDEPVKGVNVTEIESETDGWTTNVDEESREVTVTAPAAPEEQEEGVDIDYGDYDFTLTTNLGQVIPLTLTFEEAAPEEDQSSVGDVRDQLRNLSSNLTSGELSSNLSSSS